jgi:hypothetical protein
MLAAAIKLAVSHSFGTARRRDWTCAAEDADHAPVTAVANTDYWRFQRRL